MNDVYLFQRSENIVDDFLWQRLRAVSWWAFLLIIVVMSMLSGGYITQQWLLFSAIFYLWLSLALVLFSFGAHINWRALQSAKWTLIVMAGSLFWLALPLMIPIKHALYEGFKVAPVSGVGAPDWFSPQLSWSVSPDRTRWLLLSELLMLCLFISTVAMVDSRQRLKQLLVLLMVIGTAHASIGLIAKFANVLLVDPRQVDGHFYVARGLFVNRNHFSAFLVLTLTGGISLAWYLVSRNSLKDGGGVYERSRVLLRSLAIFSVIAITLVACFNSASRGAVMALGVGALITLGISKQVSFSRHKRYLLCAVVVVCVGFFSFGQDILARLSAESFSFGERWIQWRVTLAAIFDNPLLGYGGGSYATVFQVFRDQAELRQVVYAQSHNYYLHLWLERGLVGLGLWLMFLTIVFSRLFSVVNKVSSRLALSVLSALSIVLIAALVQSLVDFNLQILNIRAFFFILLALVYAVPHIRHLH